MANGRNLRVKNGQILKSSAKGGGRSSDDEVPVLLDRLVELPPIGLLGSSKVIVCGSEFVNMLRLFDADIYVCFLMRVAIAMLPLCMLSRVSPSR
jgi:hypothetical protein